MCLSPGAGAAAASWPLPLGVDPLLTAVAAGVIAQAARLLTARDGAAVLVAAAVTALAVLSSG